MSKILTSLLLLLLASTASAADKGEMDPVKKMVRGWSAIDTNYIEPQHYDFAFMVQGTWNYDLFWLKSGEGQNLLFTQDIQTRVGPYFGWRWAFLGYTFDLKNIGFGGDGKRQFTLSIYSSQIGVDIFWRHTGSDYRIAKADMGEAYNTDKLNDVPFDGVDVGITGANLYYIFNHKRFSYPAAFSQSTVQKMSCGSWMAGLGYTRQSISLDYDKLAEVVESRVEPAGTLKLDTGLMFQQVKFTDINASVGYGYNWVFAKNWLLGASLSVALAYKNTHSQGEKKVNDGFSLDNFGVDGIGRLGLVYNDTKYFFGFSGTLHSYNYSNSRFRASNMFGSINVYAGFNFGMKPHYKRLKAQNKKRHN